MLRCERAICAASLIAIICGRRERAALKCRPRSPRRAKPWSRLCRPKAPKSTSASRAPAACPGSFREPIATLMVDGKTVGRHYAGPNWEYIDGSGVAGKVAASAPGRTAADIPWLKLDATTRRGRGTLSAVSTIQRIDTRGGVHSGPCDTAGTFFSAPYSAVYVFLQQGG